MYNSALLLLAHGLLLAVSDPMAIERRECGTIVHPSRFWGISSQSPSATQDYGPHPPDNFLDFRVSQTGNGKSLQSEDDLIAKFTVPCPPSGKSPYRVEFLFEPISDYSYNGNTNVDVFTVTGSLPAEPTWNNMRTKTGAKVGSFAMPQGQDQVHKVFSIGQVTCKTELGFRVSVANTGCKSGSVSYAQQYYPYPESGLRIRYGC